MPEDTNACQVPEHPTDTCTDVYVFDRTNSSLERASVASSGTQADNHSGAGDISGDGRFVVFNSIATNLAANDTNALVDIFVRDRQEGTTTRVSVSTSGGQSPRINVDPRRHRPRAPNWGCRDSR